MYKVLHIHVMFRLKNKDKKLYQMKKPHIIYSLYHSDPHLLYADISIQSDFVCLYMKFNQNSYNF